ncbi:MAG: hypothetical protein EOO39_42960, partial [Cytophagaceae bacterium]
FYFEPTADAIGQDFIQQGRERYQRLLSMIARSAFRPTSWSGEYAGISIQQPRELHTQRVSLSANLLSC